MLPIGRFEGGEARLLETLFLGKRTPRAEVTAFREIDRVRWLTFNCGLLIVRSGFGTGTASSSALA